MLTNLNKIEVFDNSNFFPVRLASKVRGNNEVGGSRIENSDESKVF